jgi:hypothetical protein
LLAIAIYGLIKVRQMKPKRFITSNLLWIVKVLCMTCVAYPGAQASGPVESLVCTSKPRTSWVGEKRIRQAFGESAYAKVFFKVTKGNCYEFYAIGKDGSVVEAYYDPVSMQPVRISRFDRNGNSQAPDKTAANAQLSSPVKATAPK